MAMEVGAAYVSIVPSFKGFGTELAKQLKAQTSGVGEKAGQDISKRIAGGFRNAGDVTSGFGKQVTRNVTLPIGGIAAASFTAFASFDQTIRQAGSALDLPAAGMENLTQLALKMGRETSFSAGAAADAILELAKGGMSEAQIQGGGLQQTLTLAAAGGLELGNAATFMTNTLNTFGLGAKSSADVAAALAGGANASTASVESLGQALSQVGPGARNAGLDLNTTVGALALFDQYGIKGSDAGTSLKTMLSRLVPQTDAAATAMQKLGLDFTDAQGNIVPLGNVADQLKSRLGGLSEAQRTSALNTIFGSDASRAASVLMRSGSVQLNKMTAATRDLGAAQRQAAVNTSGASGSMEQLKGSLETAGITIGTALAPHVTAMAKQITELVNRFTSLDAGTQRTILVIGGIAAASGPAIVGLGYLTTGIGRTVSAVSTMSSGLAAGTRSVIAFGTGLAQPQSGLSAFASRSQQAGSAVSRFGAFVGRGLAPVLAPVGKGLRLVATGFRVAAAASLAFVATPIGATIALIVGLAVVAVVLYKKWTPFRNLVNKIGAALVAFGKDALAVGKIVLAALVSAAVAVGNAFKTAWRGLVTAWNAVKPIFAQILDIITTPLRAVITFVKGWINIIIGVFTGNAGRIGQGIGQAFSGLLQFLIVLPLKILKLLAPLIGFLIGLGIRAVQGMYKAVVAAAPAVLNFFLTLPSKILRASGRLVSFLAKLAFDALRAMARASANGIATVLKFFLSLPGKAVSAAKSLGSRLVSLGRSALSAMGNAVSSAGRAVLSFFSALPGRIASFLSSLPSKLASTGRSAMSSMGSAITSAASAVTSFFSSLPSKIVSALGNLGSALAGAGRDLIAGLVSGIRGAAGQAAQAAKDAVGGAIKAATGALRIGSPSKVFIEIGRNVVEGLAIGLRTNTASLTKATNTLIERVRSTAKKMIDAAKITPADRKRLLAEDARLQKTLANNAARYTRDAETKRKRGRGAGLTAAQLAAYRREDELARARRSDILADLRRGSELSTAEIRAIGAARDNVIRYLSRTYKAVAPFRKQLDAVNAQINATTERLKSLREARASVVASIRDTALQARDFFGSMMNAIAPEPAAVLARLKANLAAASGFQTKLRNLQRLGLNAEVIQQIAAQGAEAGSQMADVLLRSTPEQVRELNKTYAAIGTTATNTGNLVAGGMYDAGIKAAEGLLKGLQSRKKQLESYLAQVANSMVAVLKKALKIKSPSQVMAAEVGSPLGLGIVGGLEGERRTMDRALSSFVAVPRVGSLRSAWAGAQTGAMGNVRVFIGDRELTDIVRVEVDDAQTSQVRQLVNGRRV